MKIGGFPTVLLGWLCGPLFPCGFDGSSSQQAPTTSLCSQPKNWERHCCPACWENTQLLLVYRPWQSMPSTPPFLKDVSPFPAPAPEKKVNFKCRGRWELEDPLQPSRYKQQIHVSSCQNWKSLPNTFGQLLALWPSSSTDTSKSLKASKTAKCLLGLTHWKSHKSLKIHMHPYLVQHIRWKRDDEKKPDLNSETNKNRSYTWAVRHKSSESRFNVILE